MKRVIMLGLLLVATAAMATTYVRVEKDGTKTYSDRPMPGGQPIDIQPAQTYSAPPSPIASSGSRVPSEEQSLMDAANFRYSGCALTPRSDETLYNPPSVTVTVMLTPGLRTGDRVNFSLDGQEVSGEPSQTSMVVSQPDRGSHTVNVQVRNQEGRTVCSASTTFHVQRPTINSPTRQPPRRPSPPRPTPH